MEKWDQIQVDVDDFIAAGFGTAWHRYMAPFVTQVPGWYSEQTLQMQQGNMTIQGTLDLRCVAGAIEDFKCTSAWAFVFGKPEWEQQLNVYALLCRANNIPVTSLTINAFLKDWSDRNVHQYAPAYPDRPFHTVRIPLWNMEQQKKFVADKVADHLNGMRPCTPEEMWQRPSTWAVLKPNMKKAMRVLDSEIGALNWLGANTNKATNAYIQHRPGSCRRCESYCMVRSVCPYKQT